MAPGDRASACPAIVGPTAVGKTVLITALASRHHIEVISLDSRQIYRGLRIGTAQPTAEEQAVCPHHLVDFLPPEERYDGARFRRDFCRVYAEIVARGAVPVLVGGAGLYLTALCEGFMDVPGSTPERLAELRREMDSLADDDVRRELLEVDPASHARIHTHDRYRSRRALEVYRLSGRPLSELQDEQRPDPALGLAFPTFVLERPVADLDRRIAERTRTMLAGGWLQETRDLLARHRADSPGLRSIGYREIVRYVSGELDEDDLQGAIVRCTRQYAKRQRTWFRHVESVGRGTPDEPTLAAAIGRELDRAARD